MANCNAEDIYVSKSLLFGIRTSGTFCNFRGITSVNNGQQGFVFNNIYSTVNQITLLNNAQDGLLIQLGTANRVTQLVAYDHVDNDVELQVFATGNYIQGFWTTSLDSGQGNRRDQVSFFVVCLSLTQ